MVGLVGGIEAGGTKFVCSIGSGPDDLQEPVRFETRTPEKTVVECTAWFKKQQDKHGPLKGLGIASFGPVDLRQGSETYGYITTTPKRGWANTPLVKMFEDALGLPVGLDTDVNGAALAEGRWGAAQGLDTFVYLTIGTGIGGGVMAGGKLLHGMLHPEIGHILLRSDPRNDPYTGRCQYHGVCFEGLASGPAIEERWGVSGDMIPPSHPAWILESYYIAQAIESLICTISPQRVILGGGVMKQEHLFPMIRAEVPRLLNGYVAAKEILEQIDMYIVPPGLGDRSGVLGAIALGMEAAERV
jgi:fructokinase